MSEMETMVENENLDTAVDDTLPEDVVEETDESEESLESLNEGEEEAKEPEAQQEQASATEPGWIKRRVEKAVSKAVAETEARMNAMFEEKMAPIRAKMMEDEAQELVRSRKVGDIETARELVRLRNGQSTVTEPPKQQEQPRNEQGRFAPKEDPVLTARIDLLAHQADKIKANGGPDVIAEFEKNPEINRKVKSGEMDFYDVAEQMKQPARRKPPAPMRSPNGASGQSPNAIESMSDEQFARMEKRIKEGARYSLR